ncbi:hypothetical protein [Pyruvatibacter mobilis]|uniref:hypothetical protein n=1 Tax=Pyruvatibacter mobilis TaxID=1712261 RepID=UPI003BAE5FA6
MTEFLQTLKNLRSVYERAAANERASNPTSADQRAQTARELLAVEEELIRLKGLTSALPPDLGNISDLPEELRAELSIAKTDELEDQIVTVINAYGGTASLDQILVGLFRRFKVVQKRRFLQNKLYRMTMVWSVDGRKGVYTTTEPPEGTAETGKATVKEDEWDFEPSPNDETEVPF